MAGRIRSIKPEILDDEEVATLSDEAWRLWVSMWLLVDDYGNCRAGDRYLSALVWQDSSRAPRVPVALAELQAARRLELYTNNGERYASIRNWGTHQRIDNAGKARVPGPDHEKSVPCTKSRGFRREHHGQGKSSPLDQRPTTPTNDPDQRTPTEDSTDSASPRTVFDFDAVYASYPRKEGKKRGMQRCRSQITTTEKYASLVRAVKNYSERIAGSEVKFIKQFDTFMGCWEDYEDAGTLTPNRPMMRGLAPPIPAYAQSGEEPL